MYHRFFIFLCIVSLLQCRTIREQNKDFYAVSDKNSKLKTRKTLCETSQECKGKWLSDFEICECKFGQQVSASLLLAVEEEKQKQKGLGLVSVDTCGFSDQDEGIADYSECCKKSILSPRSLYNLDTVTNIIFSDYEPSLKPCVFTLPLLPIRSDVSLESLILSGISYGSYVERDFKKQSLNLSFLKELRNLDISYSDFSRLDLRGCERLEKLFVAERDLEKFFKPSEARLVLLPKGGTKLNIEIVRKANELPQTTGLNLSSYDLSRIDVIKYLSAKSTCPKGFVGEAEREHTINCVKENR